MHLKKLGNIAIESIYKLQNKKTYFGKTLILSNE